MKSVPTIAFDYRPSRWLGVAAVLVCLAAASAPWLSGLPLPARVALSLSVIACAAFALNRFWNPRFQRIAYRRSGWAVVDGDGNEHAAVLDSHAHLGVLLALGLRIGPGVRLRVVLTPDNLDADSRRRLVLALARAEIVRAR